MRVVMLNYGHLVPDPAAPEIGGAARQCLKLSAALVRQGVEVTILTNRRAWRAPASRTLEGVRVIQLNAAHAFFERPGLRRFGRWAFMLRTLAHLARHREDYDVIHAHSALITGFVAVLAGRWLGRKSVIKVMNSGVRNDIVRFRQDRTLPGARWMADYLIHCDRVITLNPLAYAELLELGYRPEQIARIPNGVEVHHLTPKTDYTARGPVRVMYAGRLEAIKGLEGLVAAFGRLPTTIPCELVLYGKGPLRERLAQQITALGLTGRVRLAGEVMEITAELLAADVFVLPSRAEGISNALLEAMAVGLPCLASAIPGNALLIQSEHNGLLTPPDDEAALAAALGRLVQAPDLRARLGRAARATVAQEFEIGQVARRYQQLYGELLGTAQALTPTPEAPPAA